MSTHPRSAPTRPESTDSPTPTDTTPATAAAGPATFDPGCRRRLVNLVDRENQAMPRTWQEGNTD
jgi:hypothetical protein